MCQYKCTRNVLWCQVHSLHIHANHKTSLNYNNSKHTSRRRKFSRRSCRDSNLRPFDYESGALTTDLSPLAQLCRLCKEARTQSKLQALVYDILSSTTAYARKQGTQSKLQALVYDILSSTTAVFSSGIGSRKLSANEQFFRWCSNSSKLVTNNSDKTRRIFYSRQQSLHQHKLIKPQSFESRWNVLGSLLQNGKPLKMNVSGSRLQSKALKVNACGCLNHAVFIRSMLSKVTFLD